MERFVWTLYKDRHTGTYKTAYAHLSGIHKRIKIGSRVSQGKIIGYVGSSGRSTGHTFTMRSLGIKTGESNEYKITCWQEFK